MAIRVAVQLLGEEFHEDLWEGTLQRIPEKGEKLTINDVGDSTFETMTVYVTGYNTFLSKVQGEPYPERVLIYVRKKP